MSITTPVVSVILPTYNRVEVLPRAIASVQAQTFTDWELLVVDDKSTDTTLDVLHEYARTDGRIRVQARLHAGPSACRNFALSEAAGRYVCCLDSDDEYLPDHIALRLRCMEEEPELGFLHGGVRVLGGPEKQYVPDVRDRSKMILITECIVGGTFFGRREVFIAAGGWRDVYSEDSDLFHRISALCPTRRVTWPTYIYHRESQDSRSDSFSVR